VALRLEDKKAIVAEVAEVAANSLSAVAAEYRGISVSQMTELRVQARKNGVYLRVVRNTLARRAIEGTPYACLSDSLVGPLVIAFSREDPGAAARIFRDFSKENELLVVKALSIGGKLLPPKDLEALAKLPTREEALASLLAVMQAPMSKFVRTIAEPHGKFVRLLAAYRDKKQA